MTPTQYATALTMNTEGKMPTRDEWREYDQAGGLPLDTDNGAWLIRVYNNKDQQIASWVIQNKLDHEAYSEAASEVERNWFGRQWTITQI